MLRLTTPKPLRALAALALLLAACGTSSPDGPAPPPGETPPPGAGPEEKTPGTATTPSRVATPPASARALPFHLYVSNQSFDLDPASLELYIDDLRVVAGDFRVEGQHNWLLFDFDLEPGDHVLRAVSINGEVESSAPFSVARQPWAVVNFWYYKDSPGTSDGTPPSFSVNFSAEQPGFD
ncbi:MAG TPA: hypothetical protein VFS00_30790 [Polyangiaceae bacterium]|nr:hypothetical protein [Polyangiaceae bacterium]